MPEIASETFDPNLFDTHQVHQVYNGMDCCLTGEILNELRSMRNSEPVNYGFSRALQGPILEIMLRGFRVDRAARNALVTTLREERGRINLQLQKMCLAAIDMGVNPNSTLQLQELFYKKMHLPEIWSSKKGKRSLSMDRSTLEKLTAYYHATPFVNHVLAIRERDKLLQMLETEISADGRYRTSYNIAGTETSRLSSSSWVDDTGGNAQNMPPFVRRVFVADPGYRLYCIDLEQAESREVGLICGLTFDDWTYLDACEAGDLHTFASRLIWPEMPWTGDIKRDRKIADQNFYRDFSYRDMAKRGGHGTSYYGTPFTMAMHLKVPPALMVAFQRRFFDAFPAIPRWHQDVATRLQTTSVITNNFGVDRAFYGRPGDDTTLREAIAHGPQSSTAFRTNLGLWRIWDRMGKRVQLLGQTHDSITFQAPEVLSPGHVIAEALTCMSIPIRTPSGRVFNVPGEAKVGWNWAPEVSAADQEAALRSGKKVPKLNLNGLRKWKGEDTRVRLGILDEVN